MEQKIASASIIYSCLDDECGTNLKIRFATDSQVNGGSRSNSFGLFLGVKHFCPSLSQINGIQKSVFSEISKK
ncbi:hypothetical protein DWV63_14095 [Enterococcus durans]|nr:hypothetical protein DWV63_14095 [Enterococcus durans]